MFIIAKRSICVSNLRMFRFGFQSDPKGAVKRHAALDTVVFRVPDVCDFSVQPGLPTKQVVKQLAGPIYLPSPFSSMFPFNRNVAARADCTGFKPATFHIGSRFGPADIRLLAKAIVPTHRQVLVPQEWLRHL